MSSGHRLQCWDIPREWYSERTESGLNCCLSLKYFYQWTCPYGSSFLLWFSFSISLSVFTTKANLYHISKTFLGLCVSFLCFQKAGLLMGQKADSSQTCLELCWLIPNGMLGCFWTDLFRFFLVGFVRLVKKKHNLFLTSSNSFISFLNIFLKILSSGLLLHLITFFLFFF